MIYIKIDLKFKMNFESNYNQIYNNTIYPLYNIRNTLSNMDLTFENFLYNYERHIFDISLYLLRWCVYYIFFMILFEFISKILDNISIHSSVTRRYIRKYNELLNKYETGYSTDCNTIHKLINEKKQQLNKISGLKNDISEVTKKYDILMKTNFELTKTINDYMVKIIGKKPRDSAVKSSQKIKSMIESRLI